MTHLDLADIRAMNAKRLDGYWRRTIAALCDEVERLRKEPEQLPDLDAIRRLLDAGVPIPPWIVRGLCDRVEHAEQNAAYQATLDIGERLIVEVRYERLLAAARAWDDAIGRPDGIVAAEQELRRVLRECES